MPIILDNVSISDGASIIAPIAQAQAPEIIIESYKRGSAAASITLIWENQPEMNDIGIAIVEQSGNSGDCTISSEGWAQVPGSPVTDLATTAGTKLQVFWKRILDPETETEVVFNRGTPNPNHMLVSLLRVSGCTTTGNPWDVITTGTKTTASTSMQFPSTTTTVDKTAVLLIAAIPSDPGTDFWFTSPLGNTNLTAPATPGTGLNGDGIYRTIVGNGGAYTLFYGIQTTAGNIGNNTSTITAGPYTNAYMVIAFKN
jgi:hypothetical protein